MDLPHIILNSEFIGEGDEASLARDKKGGNLKLCLREEVNHGNDDKEDDGVYSTCPNCFGYALGFDI